MAEMTPIARRALLALYLTAVTAVFLVLGFPSEALRQHAARRLSAALPGLTVTVAGVQPAFPAALELTGVRIAQADRPLAAVDQLTVRPELLSLLQDKSVYRFEGSAGGGDLSGRAEVDSAGSGPRVRMNAQVGGIQLQQIPALRDLYGGRLSGRMDGTFALTDAGALTGKLSVTEAQVDLPVPVFEQTRFSFRTADVEVVLQNRSLLVRNGRLRGAELDADLSGTISLDPQQAARAVNLVGRVTPHAALLARAEGILPANLLRRRGALPFRVTGPLDAPGFSLN
jgi:type II secretion system protein N